MKRYLKIYFIFLGMNFSRLLAYKANFFNEIINSIVWGSFSILSVFLLTSKTSSVYGWSRGELLILTASFGLIWGFFHLLFVRSFRHMIYIIDRGMLDTYLLKPLDSQFMTTTSIINYTSFIRVLINLILLIFFIHAYHYQVGLIQIIGYCCLSVFGIVILYTLFFASNIILIWNPKLDNLIEVMYTLVGFAHYPPQMFYRLPLLVLFSILPLTFAVVAPTKILFSKILLGDVSGLIVSAVILFFISHFFWKFALRHYTSASG